MSSLRGTLELGLLEFGSLLTERRRMFEEAEVPGASLAYHGDVPVLTLTGTPREMGWQHGRLLGPHIRRLMRTYLDRFLVGYGKGSGGLEAYLAVSRRMVEALPAHHREEIEGLAEGAEVPLDLAVLLQTFLDIHKLFFCSTLVTRSPAGNLLFGRNLDFPSFGIAHRYGLVVIHRAPGRRPTASVTWPGFIGTLSGMNDTGLSLAVMVVYFVSDRRQGIPYPLLFRRILEEEDTLAGVEARLTDADRTNANNLMAAAGDGTAGFFEIRPEGVERYDPAEGVCFGTNHFRGEGRRSFTPHPVYLSSYYRLWRLRSHIRRTKGHLALRELKRALADVAPPVANLQSMVFLPERRELLLAMGSVPAARAGFRRLRLFG